MAAPNELSERASRAIQQVGGALAQIPTNAMPDPGTSAMQVRTEYATAVKVVVPRDLREVKRRCLEEAALAGEALYYSWMQGGEIIEGPSVQCTNIAARQFGNCGVRVWVEETADAYIFHGAFVDLETGYNYSRPFRTSKVGPKKKDGSPIYKDERGKDVIFQVGVSKASRNAVANAVPRWLIDDMVEVAKENVVKKFTDMGPEKAKAKLEAKSASLGVALDRVEAKFGKQKGWSVREFVQIASLLRAIENGEVDPEEVLPRGDTQTSEAGKTDEKKVDAAAGEEKSTSEGEKTDAAEGKKSDINAVTGFEQSIDECQNTDQARVVVEAIIAAAKIGKLASVDRGRLMQRLADREAKFTTAKDASAGDGGIEGFNPETEEMGFGKYSKSTWMLCPKGYLKWITENMGDKSERVAKAQHVLNLRKSEQ